MVMGVRGDGTGERQSGWKHLTQAWGSQEKVANGQSGMCARACLCVHVGIPATTHIFRTLKCLAFQSEDALTSCQAACYSYFKCGYQPNKNLESFLFVLPPLTSYACVCSKLLLSALPTFSVLSLKGISQVPVFLLPYPRQAGREPPQYVALY